LKLTFSIPHLFTILLGSILLPDACQQAAYAAVPTATPPAAATTVAELIDLPMGSAGQLNYIDEGPRTSTAPPVVFVHSFAGNASQWESQIAHLKKLRRVVALDLRGHGKSAAPVDPGEYAVEALAGDIAAVVDHLRLTRFVLVGHGLGGAASVAYAARSPARVDMVVLIDVPGRIPAAQANKILDALNADFEAAYDRYWKSLWANSTAQTQASLRQDKQRMAREAALSFIRSSLAYDPSSALRAYLGPKRMIATDRSDGPHTLARHAPDIPVRVIAGTSHWPHMDKPAELNRVLDEMLAR